MIRKMIRVKRKRKVILPAAVVDRRPPRATATLIVAAAVEQAEAAGDRRTEVGVAAPHAKEASMTPEWATLSMSSIQEKEKPIGIL